MKDFSKYIGIEFEQRGRGPRFDCWGLAVKVLDDEFGISNLPSLASEYTESRDRAVPGLFDREIADSWRPVENPEPGDVAVFNMAGLPAHVGVMIDKKRMIHTIKGAASCIERIDSLRWKGKFEGFYRHEQK